MASETAPIIRITTANLAQLNAAQGFALGLYKEVGYSSGFFVNQLRKRLSHLRGIKRFKLGHAGTLDPFAEGVLILLGGKDATRQQSDFMQMPKRYLAKIRFGATTPSLDPDTEVTERDASFTQVPADLAAHLPAFLGEIDQVPPLFSAKHVDGQRAYKLARAGVEMELAPSRVTIHEISLVAQGEDWAEIDVLCGSGVYIRSLARDIAASIGTLGYLETLVRTEAGGFKLAECVYLRACLDAAGTTSEKSD